MNTGITYCL